jgi:acyl-homoserine-lactone acylase
MVMDLQYSDVDYEAQLWLSDAQAMCRAHPTMLGSNGPVDVSAACPALEEYNKRGDLNSRGYLLWRRFGERIWLDGESSNPWADSFNPKDPVNTPAKLNTDDSGVRKAFADAVGDLEAAHIPFDAPLGRYAYVIRNGHRIPIHGGTGVGLFNVIYEPFNPQLGYPDVQGGSTYIQVVRVTGGCPDAHTIETHSQSTDPTSPYYADQTWMYSRKQWMAFPFCQNAILHSPLQIINFGGGYPPTG